MTPEKWVRMSPQQQWAFVNQYGPPPPHFAAAAVPAPQNSLAKTALTIGAIGLLIFPIVLGPIAVILGLVAQTNRQGGREAGIAVAIGLLDIVIGLAVLAWLSAYL